MSLDKNDFESLHLSNNAILKKSGIKYLSIIYQ
jgi:hypothetical protein